MDPSEEKWEKSEKGNRIIVPKERHRNDVCEEQVRRREKGVGGTGGG